MDIKCKRAHNGWRPLLPPDIESLGRAEIEREMQRVSGLSSQDITEDNGNGGDAGACAVVRVWLTDAYVLAAMKLPT